MTIRVSAARNQYMGVEELTEEELVSLRTGERGPGEGRRLEEAFSAADDAEASANERAQAAAKAAKPRFT